MIRDLSLIYSCAFDNLLFFKKKRTERERERERILYDSQTIEPSFTGREKRR
jgi:hypothetical protein